MSVTNLADAAGGLVNGQLPAFAWPGGYPLVYVTDHGGTLCAACATRDYLACLAGGEDMPADPPTAVSPHYEGPDETCEDCGARIESAYGDPDALKTTPDRLGAGGGTHA